MNEVILVVPNPPWDENRDGINKIVFNLLKHAKKTKFHVIALSNHCSESRLDDSSRPSSVESYTEIAVCERRGRMRKVLSIPKEGTMDEQLPKGVRLRLIDQIGRLRSSERTVHFFTSRFISLLEKELPSRRVIFSLIDNKELYYERKIQRSGALLGALAYLQAEKIRKIYARASRFPCAWHFVSRVDAEKFSASYGCSVSTIENGVEIPELHDADAQVKRTLRSSVVFHGNFGYEPNLKAVEKILLVLDDPSFDGVSLLVFGKGSKALRSRASRITVLGEVSSVYDHLSSADVYFAPLELGSGIKNKILEAMAAGMAVLTTEVGADGIGGRESGLTIVDPDSINEVRASLRLLLCDDQSRIHLGGTARRHVAASFSWSAKISAYERLYENRQT